MLIKGKYSWVKHLDFMIIDLVALLCSFFISYYYKFRTLKIGESWNGFIVILILLSVFICFIVNPYSGIFHRRYYQDIKRSLLLVITNALSAFLIFYVLKIGAEYSREVVICTYTLYFFVSVVSKYLWKKLLISRSIRIHKTRKMTLFLISYVENAEKDISSIYSTDLPLYDIRGIHFVNNENTNQDSLNFDYYKDRVNIPIVSDKFIDFVLDNNIEEVLVCVPLSDINSNVIKTLVANGVGVNIIVESLVGFQTEEQYISSIGVNKVLSVGTFAFSTNQQFFLIVKRLFDILCGLIGLIVLIPITFFVKLAYLISGDTASIFYRQKRVGLNGKIIKIWKYRSMSTNADEILKELLKDEKHRKEWEENQKFENDPRITKVGAFLRKTSIDELPQLINVLKGDMSLVGPRPLVEGELEAHNGLKLYQKLKPGITGWWGCNGRSNIDYRERMELEYYYIKNCSIHLDFICIVRTVFAVLKKDGAK